MAKFKHPENGHIESSSSPLSWLWALLFSWLYFLFRGNLKLAAIGFVLHLIGFFTFIFGGFLLIALVNIIYAIFVYKINNKYYLHRGWIKVADEEKIIKAKEEMKAKVTKPQGDKTE